MTRVLCAAFFSGLLAIAQKPGAPLTFDAASVKPAIPVGNFNPPYRRTTPVRIEYRNYPLARLIAEAYNLDEYKVQGPTWIARERYEVTANRPRGTTVAQTRLMMQSLLQERFHLTTHRAFEEKDVYYLLPGKNVALLRPEQGEPDVLGCQSFGTLSEFSEMLAWRLHSPVIDKTNIPGTFYFILSWSSSVAAREPAAGLAPPPPMPSTPPPCPGWSAKTMPPLASDMFEALRNQMGLSLEKHGRAPVDVLVVDRADKLPESN